MARATKPNAKRTAPAPASRRSAVGLGQLTLVEHALCPLDAGQSLRENAMFETGYYYADKNRPRQKATVKVACPAEPVQVQSSAFDARQVLSVTGEANVGTARC